MLAHLALQHSEVDPLSIWAEREDRARLVLRDDLGIRWSNPAAIRFVAETGLFQSFGDRLVPRDSRWSLMFQAFVRSSGAVASTLCLSCHSADPVLCTALNLGQDAGERLTGLTLRRATGVVPLHATALQAAFHLTLSERRVVELLFAGKTAEEVGADLRVAIGTVRVHIRHIYEKLNVASREAMFHKLAPFLSTH